MEAYFTSRLGREKESILSRSKDGVAACYARVFLQNEKARTLAKAEAEKAKKIAEGEQLLQKIQNLQAQEAAVRIQECKCVYRYYAICTRCSGLNRITNQIKNDQWLLVYEWPLPGDNDCADVVVFFQHPPADLISLLNMHVVLKLFQSVSSSAPTICMLLVIQIVLIILISLLRFLVGNIRLYRAWQ